MKKILLSLFLFLSLTVNAETNFQYAYKQLLKYEGNYNYSIYDNGGETYRGITRKYNSEWLGWSYIDRVAGKSYNQEIVEANFLAQDFYLSIWVREGFDGIINKEVASYLFDYRIHAYSGIRRVRHIVNNLGIYLEINNKMDEDMAFRLNFLNPDDFIEKIKKERIKHYCNLVKRNPNQKIWLNGWLIRANYLNKSL